MSTTPNFRDHRLPRGQQAEQSFVRYCAWRGWECERVGVHDDATQQAATKAERLAPDFKVVTPKGTFLAEVKSEDSWSKHEYEHQLTLHTSECPVAVVVAYPKCFKVVSIDQIKWVPYRGEQWREGTDQGSGQTWGKFDLSRAFVLN